MMFFTRRRSTLLMTMAVMALLVTLPAAFTTTATAQEVSLDRVEPLHWWTGMQNPELQVLMYGEQIGRLTPRIDYEGVRIQRVQKVENPNYLFVYLHISPETKPGSFDIKLHLHRNTGSSNGATGRNQRNEQSAGASGSDGTLGEEVVSYSYELREREPQSANREGFNSSDVIYLITPDRFANGNTHNDELSEYEDKLNREDDYGRHGGDIQGIIDHLDYIEEMGFTAIWLNPVLENAMPEASYHGYATTDYYKIDPRFGSNELYRKLSKEAEKRGIKLIKDIITNHSGSEHWWMEDPPTSDWVHYSDEFHQTTHRRTTLHDPYASDIDRKQFAEGWFVETMPDLNQSNPLMADYLIYNSIWWIEYAGLEGIRHDTQPYPGEEFLEQWTCRIMEEYPNFNIVGEEWSLSPLVIAKWQRGSRNPADFGSCLPSLMDFPLQVSLAEAITGDEEGEGDFAGLYETLSFDYIYPDPYNLVIFPDNHDMDRFYRQVGHDYDLFRMGLTYYMTMRGIPQIYYGTELLMSNEKEHDHGQIREDFPGGWETDQKNAFTGEGISKEKQQAQEFVQELVNWRKNSSVIHDGQLMHYAPHNGMYVYFRYNDEQTVMVVLNRSDENQLIDPDRYYERMSDFSRGIDVISGESYSLDNLKILGKGSLILELDGENEN